MKSMKVMMIAALVILSALILPVAARTGYDTIQNGDIIYMYETGLDLTGLGYVAPGPYQLVYYEDIVAGTIGDSISIADFTDFTVPSDALDGRQYYAVDQGVRTGSAVFIERPYVTVDVMLANGNDILNDRTVTKGTDIQIRLKSNVPAGFTIDPLVDVADPIGVPDFAPYVELRFTNPDGGSVNVFGDSDPLGIFPLMGDETRTDAIETADVDTGNWAVKAYWRNTPAAFNDFYGDGLDSALVNFAVGSAKPTINVNTDQVIRGDGFTATITGRGSTDYWVFVEDAALDCDVDPGTAGDQSEYPLIDPFGVGQQPGVTTTGFVIGDIEDDNGEPADCVGAFAMVRTTAAGSRTITFDTYETTADRSFTLTVIEVNDADMDDSISIRVSEGSITIDAEADRVYYAGEEITFSGECTACRANEEVFLYILGPNLDQCGGSMDDPFDAVDDGVGAGFEVIDVESDDTWEFDWDTGARDFPTLDSGTYSIYAVSAEVDKCDLGDDDNAAGGEEVYAITSIQLRRPFLSASLPSTRVARGDDVVVTGTAEGLPDNVFIWAFGPNFNAYVPTTVEDDNTFEETLNELSDPDRQAGQYFVVVQHPMYNGQEDVTLDDVDADGQDCEVFNQVSGDVEFRACGPGRLMGSDAANALIEVLDDPRIDDTYVRLFFLLEEPFVNIEPISDKYIGDTFTVSGTTNVAVDDTLLISITSASFQPTDKSQAGGFSGVSGSTKVVKGTGTDNVWSFEVDTTGFQPDQYIVRAEVVETDTIATSTFFVSEVPPTTVTTAPPTTVPPTTAPPTTVPPTTVPPTTTPGFGAVIALIGLGAVAVLVLRRH